MAVRPLNSDLQTVRQVFVGGEYDLGRLGAFPRIAQRYEDIIKAIGLPVILDAGANIGAASRWFKSIFPKSAVVAVEPDHGSAAVLRENLKGLKDTYVIEAAIGSVPGHVSLVSYDQSWAVETRRSDDGLPIVTVSEAISKVDRGVSFIAKFDIEGFESDLFADNLEWLEQAYVVIVEPHDWRFPGRATSRAFQAAMGNRNFELFLSGENLIYVRL
jgi:FkbM family methyltransferase